MTDYSVNQQGYARFTPSGNKNWTKVTAWVRVIMVNGEYLEIIDNDDIKYKVLKDNFYFVEEMF